MNHVPRHTKLARQSNLVASPPAMSPADFEHIAVGQRCARVALSLEPRDACGAVPKAIGYVFRVCGPAQVGDDVVVTTPIVVSDFVLWRWRWTQERQRDQSVNPGLDSPRAELDIPVAVACQPRFEDPPGARIANRAEVTNLVAAVAGERAPLSSCRHQEGRQGEDVAQVLLRKSAAQTGGVRPVRAASALSPRNEKARRRSGRGRARGGVAGRVQTANPANLGLRSDARRVARSRPPQGIFRREDPSISRWRGLYRLSHRAWMKSYAGSPNLLRRLIAADRPPRPRSWRGTRQNTPKSYRAESTFSRAAT